jgi:uncharacterized pyridoxal phosphate-containing UPF0001 family protein
VVDLIHGLDAERVARNLERARERIAEAGRDPAGVEILAAVKYVPLDELAALSAAGLRVLGENRAQDLVAKTDAFGEHFTWDFIGNLQSRKVRDILPRVRWIHSVATDSALAQLARHGDDSTEVMVEVNVAAEAGKSGISPAELPGFLERCPVPVIGLMTMPPLAREPRGNRPHFAALRALADRHGLPQLSMGTSQDYLDAVREGATIVRLGTTLYAGAP